MYIEVKTDEQKMVFERIYKEIFSDGFFLDEILSNSIGFIYQKPVDNQPIGVMELTPFNPSQGSTVNHYYDFSKIPDIQDHLSTTWEIDKFGILPNHRKTDTVQIKALSFLLAYLSSKSATRAIALIQSRLYKSIEKFMPAESFYPADKPMLIEGDRLPVYPIVFDIAVVASWHRENSIDDSAIRYVKV